MTAAEGLVADREAWWHEVARLGRAARRQEGLVRDREEERGRARSRARREELGRVVESHRAMAARLRGELEAVRGRYPGGLAPEGSGTAERVVLS